MKLVRLILLLLIGLSISSIQAKEKRKLREMVSKATEVTGITYLLPKDFKGDFETSKEIKITQENADEIISLALNRNGYTRIKINETLSSIITTRDIRYEATEIYKGSKSGALQVPMTHDYFMLEYNFENEGISTSIVRSLRPFISRFGRIIDIKRSNKIILQDTGTQINRLINVIRSIDKAKSEDQLEREEEQLEFERKLKLEKAKGGCSCEEG